MTEPVSPENSAAPAAAGPSETLPPAAPTRALRRQFLLGGLTTAGVMVTLANRPALAGGGIKQCSVSAMGSLHPSNGVTQACGDSPSCWCNTAYNIWSDGATFNGVPVQYTHSTNITSICSTLGGSNFYCSNSNLSSLCQGQSTIYCKLANGSWVSLWTASQQGNIAAAVLNDLFYGSRYCSSPITSAINTCLSNVVSYCNSNNKTGIQSACSSLDSQLGALNTQGQTCSL